jgi:hypothetical protein
MINRRTVAFVLIGSFALTLPSFAQNSFSQRIDATVLPGETFVGQFLPSRGARRISAIVRCEVKATAYLDISNDIYNEDSVVLGASSVELKPKQAQILIVPAGLVDIQGVRIRVVNEDKTFGTVYATISVSR